MAVEARLVDGDTVTFESPNVDGEHEENEWDKSVVYSIIEGNWVKDRRGYHINPRHIIAIRTSRARKEATQGLGGPK